MKKILLFLLLVLPIFSFSKIKYEKLGNQDLYEKVLQTDKNAVIIYAAAWCPACQNFLKNYNKIKNKMNNIKTYIIVYPYIVHNKELYDYEEESISYSNKNNYLHNIYLDDELSIMEKYEIDSIPSVTLIKDGKEFGIFTNDNADIHKILKLFKLGE
ncbi:TlpA family protein disulfide reductase [Pseudostreptobacillus sp.]